jgi:hypothetical protein
MPRKSVEARTAAVWRSKPRKSLPQPPEHLSQEVRKLCLFFVGVIRADGRSIFLNNSDGVASATLLGPDSMEACYVEGVDDAQVVCVVLSRAK